MSLPFSVKLIDQSGNGFDCVATLTQAQFTTLKNAGYSHALRDCIGQTDTAWISDVTAALNAGLSVAIYQGSYSGMWSDLSLASSRAQQAISRAKLVDYPQYGTIWLNVEDIGSNSHQQIINWINTWSKAIRDAGYGAGVYCGCNTLTGDEYYYDLAYVTHYWENCSSACQQVLPVRGYEIKQTACNKSISGIIVDTDYLTVDNLGQYPEGMIKA